MSKNGNAGNGKMHNSNNNNSGSNSCNWPNRLRLSQSEGKFLMQFPPSVPFLLSFPSPRCASLTPSHCLLLLLLALRWPFGNSFSFCCCSRCCYFFFFFFSLLHYTRAFSFSIFYKHFSIAFRCAFSFGVKKNPLAVSGS